MAKNKLTPKQEKFCLNVASGVMSYADSYRDAYDAKNMGNNTIYAMASKLMADHKISIRVDELRKELTESMKYTVEDAMAEFADIQSRAKKKEDLNHEMKAVENKAKLKGLFIDKKKVEHSLGIAEPSKEAFDERMGKIDDKK